MTPADISDIRDMFRTSVVDQAVTAHPTTQPEVEGQQEGTESAPDAPNKSLARAAITVAINEAIELDDLTQGEVATAVWKSVKDVQEVNDALAILLIGSCSDLAKTAIRTALNPTPAAHRAPKIPRRSAPAAAVMPNPAAMRKRRKGGGKIGAGTLIETLPTTVWEFTGREPSYSGGSGKEYGTTISKKGSAQEAALFVHVVVAHGEAAGDFDTVTLTWVDWKNANPTTVTGTVKGASDGFKWADAAKRNLKVGIKPSRGGIKVK